MVGIATLRTRTEQRKSGKEWRVDYFICSIKNSNRGNCKNKQIRADYIEDEVKKELKKELKKIIFSKEELKKIYKESQIEINKEISKLEEKLSKYKKELENVNNILMEIYNDKVQNIITQDDFKKFYEQKAKEREKMENQIKDLELQINKLKEKIEEANIENIIKVADKILSLEDVTSEMYNKLLEKIEFDSDKNIYIEFKFSKYLEI